MQSLMADQASLDNHSRRRQRMPIVRKVIKDAIAEKRCWVSRQAPRMPT
jgi:hypothetical protein